MTLAHVRSFAFRGTEAVSADVRAEVSAGLPAFTVAGLPGNAGKKTRERVSAALAAIGLSLPPRRVAVTLSPGDALNEGSHYDLPIAIAVLTAMGLLPLEELSGYAAIGALSSDGSLEPVVGVLPAAIAASGLELGLICPAAQGGEAAWAGSVEVLAAPDLLAIINHFRGTQVLSPPCPAGVRAAGPFPDLADLHGMETAKRALEVAAAGGHSLMLVGPTDATSVLAAVLPGLLPDLAARDALEVSVIHSLAGMLDEGRLIRRPPWRAPPSDLTIDALLGGALHAGPGEVSLAHQGVLFLDDPARLPRDTMDALLHAMEAGSATFTRGGAREIYPARFHLVAAVDPRASGGGDYQRWLRWRRGAESKSVGGGHVFLQRPLGLLLQVWARVLPGLKSLERPACPRLSRATRRYVSAPLRSRTFGNSAVLRLSRRAVASTPVPIVSLRCFHIVVSVWIVRARSASDHCTSPIFEAAGASRWRHFRRHDRKEDHLADENPVGVRDPRVRFHDRIRAISVPVQLQG